MKRAAARDDVGVVAHAGKKLAGGLPELRAALARAGHPAPLWREVTKGRKAGKAVRRLVKDGAKLVFVWGGDGMVQHAADALAGRDVALAIVPAGTANLLARHLGIPADIGRAVAIGLRGARRALDVGVVNGERFAVMAGAGFDALTMRGASARQKGRLGRLAYLRSGVKAMRARPVGMKVRVDGATWFKGQASCVLFGNLGTVLGGVDVFPRASPDDGLLEVGVTTADGVGQWLRVFSRVAQNRADQSPLVRTTRGRKVVVELDRATPFELDGGARDAARRLTVRIDPGALTVCVRARREPRAGPKISKRGAS